MPRTKRTPPSTPNVNTTTEPCLASIATSIEAQTGVTIRSRRPQLNDDAIPPKGELDEIKSMLQTIIQNQEQKFSQVTKEIADLKRQNSEIQKTNIDIQNWMEFSNIAYEEIKTKITSLEKQRKDDLVYISVLEQKVKDLEITSRPSILELRNIPGKDKETANDLISIVCSISSIIGAEISQSDLRDTYRIPSKPNTPKTIIADFTSVQKRDSFLIAAKNFNKAKSPDSKLNSEVVGFPGKKLPVYISEYLPPSMKKLFYLARQFSQQNDYHYCWTANGKIFLRKENGGECFRILSEKCFTKLPVKN